MSYYQMGKGDDDFESVSERNAANPLGDIIKSSVHPLLEAVYPATPTLDMLH